MRSDEISVLCVNSRDGPISAVQDHFGVAYRVDRNPNLSTGDVIAGVIRHNAKRATSETGTTQRYVVRRKVHVNTVRALVRQSRWATKSLVRGAWYEVHPD